MVSLSSLFPDVPRLQELLTEATKLPPETIEEFVNADTLQRLVCIDNIVGCF